MVSPDMSHCRSFPTKIQTTEPGGPRAPLLSDVAAFRAPVEPDDAPLASERLLLRLRALASPVRLQILRALVVPARAPDIRVHATGERAGLGAERFLGRSTVIEHLDILEEAGLVRRVGDVFAADQQGMVAFLQDIGSLARLRALVEVDVEATRSSPQPTTQPVAPLPRLLVASGPAAGRAFALDGPGPWAIGRGHANEIALAHDPHVSRTHVIVTRDATGFHAKVANAAKNPAFVDFVPLDASRIALLRPGSVLTIGVTPLVLQA